MIKIDNPEIKNISEDYFEKVKEECLDRADFLVQMGNVLFHGVSYKILEKHKLHGGTKKSLLNILLLPANKLNNQASYHTVTLANCHPWVVGDQMVLEDIGNYLAKDANLRRIILCDPKDCFQLDTHLRVSLGLQGANSIVRDIVKKVLDYEIFDKYAYYLGKLIGVNTCPYCNRVCIHTVYDKSSKEVIRPQFDHFYPQSKHPFLGLSFFNLIPSCYYCNSSLKNAGTIHPDTHLHPYLDGYGDDYYFHIDIDYVRSRKSDPENYKVRLKPAAKVSPGKLRQIKGNSHDEGNLNLFKLEAIYPSHLDVVGELVVKCNKYSSWYSGPLLKAFGAILSTNKSEFYQYYFGNYFNETDFHRRPLSKLTKDVVKQVLPSFIK